jgi:hypothetical protein
MIDWRELPGNDWRYINLIGDQRDRCDRTTAIVLAMELVPPQYGSGGAFGLGFGKATEAAFKAFLGWLARPAGDEPSTAEDGFHRRQALGLAVEQLLATDVRRADAALYAAGVIYEVCEDDEVMPARRRRRTRAPAAARP